MTAERIGAPTDPVHTASEAVALEAAAWQAFCRLLKSGRTRGGYAVRSNGGNHRGHNDQICAALLEIINQPLLAPNGGSRA
jgi:cytosine/adenosine deaminase-related metal-dependent hydrolase